MTTSTRNDSTNGLIVRRKSLDAHKGESDLKEYRLVQLHTGLRALLVSSRALLARSGNDESLAKAAAALSVETGSFSDPHTLEGCAHFLEHMAFMGSEKYPGENHYDAFVSAHGGSCNAFTEGEYTCFSFDVQAPHLAPALDIFAQCLAAPLLSADALEREATAIENEFQLAQMEDGARLQQLVSHLSHETHPMHKFSWGNRRSLVEIPQSTGVDICETLRAFYERNYSPRRAQLVVCAPLSLDDIERLVVDSFAGWSDREGERETEKEMAVSLCETHLSAKNAGVTSTECGADAQSSLVSALSRPLFPESEFSRLTLVGALKNTHRVSLFFPLPPTLRDHTHKAAEILSHCLGHEASGSVLSFLKAKNLAFSLSAGVGDSAFDSHSGGALLSVSLKLSAEGLANWPFVVRTIFDYLAMLKRELENEKEDRLRYIFDELHTMGELSMRYRDEEEPYDLAERLSPRLLSIYALSEEAVLSSDLVFPQWDRQRVLSLVSECCAVEKAKIFLSSSLFAEKKSETEGDNESDGESEGEEDDDGESEGESEFDSEEDEEDGESEGDDGSEAESDTGAESLSLSQVLSLCEGDCVEWRDLLSVSVETSESESKTQTVWEKESWFGVRHTHRALPHTLLSYWQRSREMYSDHTPLHLPPHNPYIPLSENEGETDSERESKRRCVEQTPLTQSQCAPLPVLFARTAPPHKVYFAEDTRFARPKAELYVSLALSPALTLSHADRVMHAVVRDLSLRLWEDCVAETVYLAELAELSLSLRASLLASEHEERTISLCLSGLRDKLWTLLTHTLTEFCAGRHIDASLVNNASNDGDNNTATRLARFKQLITDDYANALLKAENIANDNRISLLIENRVTLAEKLQLARSSLFVVEMHAEALLALHRTLCESVRLTVLCEGELSESVVCEGVQEIVRVVESVREKAEKSETEMTRSSAQRTVRLPAHNIFLHHGYAQSANERNSAAEVYFQAGEYSLLRQTQCDLLESLLVEPFFDQLRTKKQLGYSVSCGMRQSHGVLGFAFKVVSSSHSLSEILSHMLRFALSAPAMCASFSPEYFQSVLDSLVQSKRAPDLSLYDAASSHWNALCERVGENEVDFAAKEKQALLLSDASLFSRESVAQFAREIFLERVRVIVSLASPPLSASLSPANALSAQRKTLQESEKEMQKLLREFCGAGNNKSKNGKGKNKDKAAVSPSLAVPAVHVLQTETVVAAREKMLQIIDTHALAEELNETRTDSKAKTQAQTKAKTQAKNQSKAKTVNKKK